MKRHTFDGKAEQKPPRTSLTRGRIVLLWLGTFACSANGKAPVA